MLREIHNRRNKLFNELIKNKIITDEIQARLAKNNVDENGSTLLHYVVKKGNLSQVKELMQVGDLEFLFIENNYSVTPLHAAVSAGKTDIVLFFLNTLRADKIIKTDDIEGTVLHLAAMSKNAEILQTLLEDKRIRNLMNKKDTYGRTALDIAVENGFDEGIRLLSNSDIAPNEYEGYGANMIDFSQEVLNEKLAKFLKILNIKSSMIIDERGNCNGWSFLYQIYLTAGKENIFFDMISALEEWDGNLESLEEGDLPESLAEIYANKKDLFTHLVNDLAILQFRTPGTNELALRGWTQSSRLEQFELIKDLKLNRQMRDVFNATRLKITESQFVEYLQFLSKYPGMSIDISGSSHIVSMYVTPEGTFKYFDSNRKNLVTEFDTAEALAEHMIKFMLKPFGDFKNGLLQIQGLHAYKFYNSEDEIPEMEVPNAIIPGFGKANGFSELHVAIMFNDLKMISTLLATQPDLIFKKDALGDTPLRMALRLQNPKCISMLKDAALKQNVKISSLANQVSFNELENLNPSFFQFLLKEEIINIHSVDCNNSSLMQSAFAYKNEDISKALMSDPAWEPNSINHDNLTALECAIFYHADKELIKKMLNKKGLDVNRRGRLGKTPLMLMLDEYCDKDIILPLLEEISRNSLNINVRDDMGQSALRYAIAFGDNAILTAMLKIKSLEISEADSQGLLHDAFKNRIDLEMFKTLIQDPRINLNVKNENGKTLLMQLLDELMANRNDVYIDEMLKILLNDKKLDLNVQGEGGKTFIMTTIVYDNKIDLETLTAWIKDPRVDLNMKDEGGNSFLMQLINKLILSPDDEYLENVLKILLKDKKLDLNVKSESGKSDIMTAITYGLSSNWIEAMIAHGSFDVTQVDDDNKNVVMVALEGNLEPALILEMMKKDNFDARATDGNGKNIREYAEEFNNEEVNTFLNSKLGEMSP